MAATASSSAFPLQGVTIFQLRALCQVLWDWDLCEDCQNPRNSPLQQCRAAQCPWGQRSERLEPFFDLYRDVTGSYVPDFFGDEDQALRNHQDLSDIILLLRQKGATLSRNECKYDYFTSRGNDETTIPQSDQDRAFDLVARVMTMAKVNSSEYDQDDDVVFTSRDEEDQQGQKLLSPPFIWPPEKSLQMALADSFPVRVHPSLQDNDSQAKNIKARLTAVNLTRIARLKIEGTNDLQHHLRLDQATGVVQVFHFTSVLKEHLLATKPDVNRRRRSNDSDGQEKAPSSCLPRPIALETLYSIQLLFPRDEKSQALLRNLVSKHGFDPDCLRFGTAPFECRAPLPRRPSDGVITETVVDEKHQALRYPIWGSRLMDLFDEIENPKPRGLLDAWLERRSKSRHVMLATLAGVAAAVLLGLLSLIVSVFQAWVAWQQWKSQNGP
ncbi:hypothetical protein B0H63DRAFT_408293 [Podospora didyma]|uniref:Uncharacterized protein n=1 Tax=Podospora didyma TaxID=330526 RepID=A0AAE0P7Z3_9PEZI|nr:hypothetical protein B0H63DRAFT_408293 [Podospora didyma]